VGRAAAETLDELLEKVPHLDEAVARQLIMAARGFSTQQA